MKRINRTIDSLIERSNGLQGILLMVGDGEDNKSFHT